MITPAYVRTMARYNAWQNRSLYTAADALDDVARKADRGAFFGSIHATLNHLLWGDRAWLARFRATEPPPGTLATSPTLIAEWEDLRAMRFAVDAEIAAWAATVGQDWLDGALTWHSGALGREMTRPRAVLVTHLFNHQTHHRGQAHALLTAAGGRPEVTDLVFMGES